MPSLLEGIEAKYGRSDSESEPSLELDVPVLYVPRKQGSRLPPVLVFNDFGIDSAGTEETLKKKCQHVQELDLAQNALSQWNEVMTILMHMPKLQFANLSFNRLNEQLSDIHVKGSFSQLKHLILNGTHISWSSVRTLLAASPSLEELHLSLNGYTLVDLEEKNLSLEYKQVKRLFFTDNRISSWKEVSKLGRCFPCLDTLVLADCPIESVQGEPVEGCQETTEGSWYPRSESECESSSEQSSWAPSPHHHFRNLKLLNLNNTLISSWGDIDRLACFPQLQHLRIHNLRLLKSVEETAHERRQLLIARLPNIVTLNGGGEISKDDREDAERAFIRYFMDKPESDRPDRYGDLVGAHGKLDPLVQVDLSPEKNVKVELTCGGRSEMRNLNVYHTISELKQKLESFAQLPASKMRLFYVDQELKQIHGPEEMKFPNKQLYSYNISNGDEIIIDSKR